MRRRHGRKLYNPKQHGQIIVNKHLLSLLMILALACAAPAQSQSSSGLPGFSIDKSAIRSLDKAENLYEMGNFKRAYFIYRNELAPVGDKYAQYMVGYMNLTGQGTDANRVAAAAWYRLAAERGTREFVLVHNQLLASLTPEQIPAYEQRFLDLRKEYGDLPILMRAVREDYDRLRVRTGSRVGSSASPVVVIDVRQGGSLESAERYYEELENRLRIRLEMIARYTNTEIADIDLNKVDLHEIEDQVNQVLESAK